MGCDFFDNYHDKQPYISIHAPAWGATPRPQITKKLYDISIHAPAWGATINSKVTRNNDRNFNPRTRMGCDPRYVTTIMICLYFNPRTRMGCDVNQSLQTQRMHPFQSTHPHGVRPWLLQTVTRRTNFNPRTRMGCDPCRL